MKIVNTRRRFDVEIWLNFGRDVDQRYINVISTSISRHKIDVENRRCFNVVSTSGKYVVFSITWPKQKIFMNVLQREDNASLLSTF
jgi:hypothetical protein